MPKAKTKKAAAKRFSMTKHGKISRRHQMASHLKIKKRKYRLYRQKREGQISKPDQKRIKRMLPYG